MAFPTTGLLDDFNRANENPIAGNWSTSALGGSGNKWQLLTNQATGLGAPSGNWYLTSYGPDCEVYCTLVTQAADIFTLWARTVNPSLSTLNGYRLVWLSPSLTITRIDGGVSTSIGADVGITFTNGDKLGMSCVGSLITSYLFHGGSWSQVDQVTDATYSAAGFLAMETDIATAVVDDFSGGTVVSTASLRNTSWLGAIG